MVSFFQLFTILIICSIAFDAPAMHNSHKRGAPSSPSFSSSTSVCTPCQNQRLQCDGSIPCQSCRQKSVTCSFGHPMPLKRRRLDDARIPSTSQPSQASISPQHTHHAHTSMSYPAGSTTTGAAQAITEILRQPLNRSSLPMPLFSPVIIHPAETEYTAREVRMLRQNVSLLKQKCELLERKHAALAEVVFEYRCQLQNMSNFASDLAAQMSAQLEVFERRLLELEQKTKECSKQDSASCAIGDQHPSTSTTTTTTTTRSSPSPDKNAPPTQGLEDEEDETDGCFTVLDIDCGFNERHFFNDQN